MALTIRGCRAFCIWRREFDHWRKKRPFSALACYTQTIESNHTKKRKGECTEFVKEAGFTPIPDRAIIVTYAPANMSERIVKFFSNEFFALQMCRDSLVLLPFGRMSFMLKKDVALEIPYNTIRKVEIKEDMLNWRIELDTDEGQIALSAQQKELSEWRHSGTLSVGMSGLGSGITGSGALKVANWHRANLDATLADLKALPGKREEIA